MLRGNWIIIFTSTVKESLIDAFVFLAGNEIGYVEFFLRLVLRLLVEFEPGQLVVILGPRRERVVSGWE